jgi:hypothetical protein
MFKNPLKMDVVHTLDEETKEYIDRKVEGFKHMLRDTFIILAIAIPCVILFGVAANATGDIIVDKLTE